MEQTLGPARAMTMDRIRDSQLNPVWGSVAEALFMWKFYLLHKAAMQNDKKTQAKNGIIHDEPMKIMGSDGMADLHALQS